VSERGTNDWQLFDWSTPAALFVPRRRQRTNVFDDSRTGKLFQFAFPLLFASACSHRIPSLSLPLRVYIPATLNSTQRDELNL
jgi:hypothetical protein